RRPPAGGRAGGPAQGDALVGGTSRRRGAGLQRVGRHPGGVGAVADAPERQGRAGAHRQDGDDGNRDGCGPCRRPWAASGQEVRGAVDHFCTVIVTSMAKVAPWQPVTEAVLMVAPLGMCTVLDPGVSVITSGPIEASETPEVVQPGRLAVTEPPA